VLAGHRRPASSRSGQTDQLYYPLQNVPPPPPPPPPQEKHSEAAGAAATSYSSGRSSSHSRPQSAMLPAPSNASGGQQGRYRYDAALDAYYDTVANRFVEQLPPQGAQGHRQ
jgi:hypothetical protein